MAQTNHFPRRRLLMVGAPLLAGVLLLGACKSSDTNTTSSGNQSGGATTTAGGNTTTTASGGGSSGTASQGTTTGTTAASASLNGLKVWFHGFRYDLGEIAYAADKQEVTIKTKVTNLGNDPATPSPAVALVKGGEQIARGGVEQSATITGGKTVDDALYFQSVENFTVAGTTLLFSDGSSFQEVSVPLDGKGQATTLEPIEQKENVAPIKIGNVTMTPKKVEVRFDLPNNHGYEAEAGTAVLIITGSTKNEGTTTAVYDPAGITVTTSTGTYPVEFISETAVPAGQTDDKTAFYFEIKQPIEGDWTLDFKDQPFGAENALVSAQLKSKLINKPAGSTTGTTR